MANERETIQDHAWRHHSGVVGEPFDLIEASWRMIGSEWGGYTFYIDELGLVHMSLALNPIDKNGFVIEDGIVNLRETSTEELLSTLPALTMSVYVFEGGDCYQDFQPNPIDSDGVKPVTTPLQARIILPEGVFYSSGSNIFPHVTEPKGEKSLRWVFERWSLNGGEDIPIYLSKPVEFYRDNPQEIRPEFFRLEKPIEIGERH